MDIWSSSSSSLIYWRSLLLILLYSSTISLANNNNNNKDLSDYLQQKDDNPAELNDFLANVVEHRSDFNFVKQAAQKFQKFKKNVETPIVPNLDLVDVDDSYAGFDFLTKQEQKRHVHNTQNLNKKRYRTYGKRQFKSDKRNRFRRTVDDFGVSDDNLGFVSNAVHKSGGTKNRHNIDMKENRNEETMYVDLGDDRGKSNPGVKTSSPFVDGDASSNFEKAESFEIEPSRYQPEEVVANNPKGNSLYSVDSGQVETLYDGPNRQEVIVNNPMGSNYPHKAITIDDNRLGLKNDVESVPKIEFEPIQAPTSKVKKQFVQKFGHGFIEIAKPQKGVESIDNRFRRRSRHHRHNPRTFQKRKLQFFLDDDMIADGDDSDSNYDQPPMRVRRDFLDALGMANVDDYADDNPYTAELDANNTDVTNDTHIVKAVTVNYSLNCGKGSTDDDDDDDDNGKTKPLKDCHFPPINSDETSTTSQKHDINNIKEILHEPKEGDGGNIVGDRAIKSKRQHKRDMFSSFDDFDDVVEEMVREPRDLSDGFMEHHRTRFNKRFFPKKIIKRVPPSMEATTSGLEFDEKLRILHKIDKKEDSEGVTTLLPSSSTVLLDVTDSSNSSDGSYEKVAHDIDKENEKLAEVVDGRTASKIVSTVFDKLHSKTSLKTKFYSGLSRKHLNYAGAVDFNIFKANETHEDVAEAKILLNQITKVLNKLVMNQVRRRLCQRLPDELREFLKTIVNVKFGGSDVAFVPNNDQGDFLFDNLSNGGESSPFNPKQLQETLVSLESLLLKYHKMNDDCQSRAQPVKDYIERHINLLRQIVSSASSSMNSKDPAKKRDVLVDYGPLSEENLIEKQLESLGLGDRNTFLPNFDVNKIVKTRIADDPDPKLDAKREVKTNKFAKSDKFKKLQRAAQLIRDKREDVRRIGDLFGEKKSKRSVDGGVPKFGGNFEQPVVYSIG